MGFPLRIQGTAESLWTEGLCSRLDFAEGFETTHPGVEIYRQAQAQYAKITIKDPFLSAFDRIPKAYQKVLEYLGANGFKENHGTEFLGCFEEVYMKDGETYMDVYIHAACVGKGNLHTDFSRSM